MPRRPDAPTLLDAVARFLQSDVVPHLADKGASFRATIAAHLAATVALDLRTREGRLDAALGRLQALLPDVVPGDARTLPSLSAREDALDRLESALAARLREGASSTEERRASMAHVRRSLREELAALNPRFDLSDEIDRESRPTDPS
jgi:hypothetical protein